jgi:hypothetical protein
MLSLYIWQYYLIVPIAALASADAVAPALNNPDGVIATFRRYPLPDAEGEYLETATHYLASFVACDVTTEGTPSREALGVALTASSALAPILWVRCANPHHPDTTPEQMGIVVASNWAAFAPGDSVDWEAVVAAMAAE